MNFCSQLSQSLFGSQPQLESQSQHSQGAFSQLTHGQRVFNRLTTDQPSQQSDQSQPLVLDPKHLPQSSLSSVHSKPKHVESSVSKRSGQSWGGYSYAGEESSSWKFFKTYNESPLVVNEQTNNSQATVKGSSGRDRKEWATCRELSGLGMAMRDLYEHIDKLNGIPELKSSLDSLMKKTETSSDIKDVMCRLREMTEHMNLQSKMIESLLEEQNRPHASFTQAERKEQASCVQVSSSCQTSPDLLENVQTLSGASGGSRSREFTPPTNLKPTDVSGKVNMLDVSADLSNQPQASVVSSSTYDKPANKREKSNRKHLSSHVRQRNEDRVHKHKTGTRRSTPVHAKVGLRAHDTRRGHGKHLEVLSTSFTDSTNITSAVLTENDLTPLTLTDCTSTSATPSPAAKRCRHSQTRGLIRKVTFSPGAKNKHLLVRRKHRHSSKCREEKRHHSSSCQRHRRSERSRSDSRHCKRGSDSREHRSHTTSQGHSSHGNRQKPEASRQKLKADQGTERKHRHRRSGEIEGKVHRRTVKRGDTRQPSMRQGKTNRGISKKGVEDGDELLLSMSAFDGLFDEE